MLLSLTGGAWGDLSDGGVVNEPNGDRPVSYSADALQQTIEALNRQPQIASRLDTCIVGPTKPTAYPDNTLVKRAAEGDCHAGDVDRHTQ
jgi:hypothetical protein